MVSVWAHMEHNGVVTDISSRIVILSLLVTIAYFLHEYLTGTPSCAQARLSGEPAGKSFFLLPYVKMVMRKAEGEEEDAEYVTVGAIAKASAVVVLVAPSKATIISATRKRVFLVLDVIVSWSSLELNEYTDRVLLLDNAAFDFEE
jgi:hypothetical protein